jgi:hypothetical protein
VPNATTAVSCCWRETVVGTPDLETVITDLLTDFRDIQHGVNDPVSGVDVKRRFRENQTPHERAQSAADVRREALPDPDESRWGQTTSGLTCDIDTGLCWRA